MKTVIHRPDKDYRSGENPKAICGVYMGQPTPDLVVHNCTIWEEYVMKAPREVYTFCKKCG